MPLTVLIAEDDQDYGRFLADLLKGAGYSCKLYTEGLSVYKALKEKSFDIAIMDLALPNFSGVEVMNLTRDRGRSIPILVISGHNSPEVKQLTKEAGAAGFLDKTASGSTILAELARLSGRQPNG